MILNDVNLDFDRSARVGFPEIVYGESKSRLQLREIAAQYEEKGENLLVTRCTHEQVAELEGVYDPVSRTFEKIRRAPEELPGLVGLIFAGSSDLPVVMESRKTLQFLGGRTVEFGDCGVAGLHRLIGQLQAISECDVVICFAGFEGALPSVLGGLIPQPIIAVPTSVGYGVAEGGQAALRSMLASCALGIAVTNIDNGCSAAVAAIRMLRRMRSQVS